MAGGFIVYLFLPHFLPQFVKAAGGTGWGAEQNGTGATQCTAEHADEGGDAHGGVASGGLR